MSDFLGTLVRRHTKPEGMVRPRLPSLFETGNAPVRDAPSAPIELNVETEAQSAPRQPRTVNATPPVSRDAVEDPRPRPVSHFPPAQAPSPPAVHQSPSAREEHFEQEASPVVMPRREIPETVSTKPQRAPEIPNAPAPPVAPPFETHVVHEALVREERVVHESQIVSTQRVVEVLMPQAPAGAIRVPPQPPLPEPIRPPPFEQPRAERTQQPRRDAIRETREAPRAETEPVIHVSIGRIDIRASEERDTGTRKSMAPLSVMTLDEYLKSRAKR